MGSLCLLAFRVFKWILHWFEGQKWACTRHASSAGWLTVVCLWNKQQKNSVSGYISVNKTLKPVSCKSESKTLSPVNSASYKYKITLTETRSFADPHRLQVWRQRAVNLCMQLGAGNTWAEHNKTHFYHTLYTGGSSKIHLRLLYLNYTKSWQLTGV